MPVTISAAVADVQADGSRRVVQFQPRQWQVDERRLAELPAEYPTLVEATAAVLVTAAQTLPLLVPGHTGHLTRAQLLTVLRRALAEQFLDVQWEHRTSQRVATDLERRHRPTLLAMFRETEDPRERFVAEAERQTRQMRAQLLDQEHLTRALAAMVADGFVECVDGSDYTGYGLPGAAAAAPVAFHGEALREALLAHLDEVRGWPLKAAGPEALAALARDHSRWLTAASFGDNTMLRAAVRQRLEARLNQALHPSGTRAGLLLDLLIHSLGLGAADAGGLPVFELADRLETTVIAPDNVLPVLEKMAEQGELRRVPGTHPPEFQDPALRLTDEPAAPAAPAAGPTDARTRLTLLKDLFAEGLITADDYAAKKAEILALL